MRTLAFVLFMLSITPVWACDACQKQQPKALQGITHGTGPQSDWDMPIIWVSAVIVVITLVFAVKYLVRPGEQDPGHIKRTVLRNSELTHG
ncbi:MAG: hypothetical protein JNJ64_00190 [Flavobacteriales bacterium]|nr:hypothetical protein [Flavobacteriales bacterium]